MFNFILIHHRWTAVYVLQYWYTIYNRWCWHWDILIIVPEWWLPRAEIKRRVKQIVPVARRSALNADWSGCFSIDFRLAWASGQPRTLVLTVWPVIDSLMWNHPVLKSNSRQTQNTLLDHKQVWFTCCFYCGSHVRTTYLICVWLCYVGYTYHNFIVCLFV